MAFCYIALTILGIISTAYANTNKAELCYNISIEDRFDCFPEDGATEELCSARGCCWKPLDDNQRTGGRLPPLNVPYCYYPRNYPSYTYQNITRTDHGFKAYLRKSKQAVEPYRAHVDMLRMDVFFVSSYQLRVKIYDAKNSRYEVPFPKLNYPSKDFDAASSLYEFDFVAPSSFKITRKSDDTVLLDTTVGSLIFSDQFIQLSTSLPSSYIYGLGEHSDGLVHTTKWDRLVFFAEDQYPLPKKSLYGSHPFYLIMEKTGKSHGVFLFNSNAMEVVIQPKPALTFRTIGGIIDLHIMLGSTPQQVISQYTYLIGRPMIPPYWSLGFHLCRFGYKTLNETKAVWMRNRKYGIPFDTQWNDLDYMDKRRDFSYDLKAYAGLPEFVQELHDVGMKYVVMVDPAIANVPHYAPYDHGVALDIFIKNASGQLLVGKVWPGNTVFPDFTHPNVSAYWTKQITNFRKQVPADGIWIDMNEPSNFVEGSIDGCPIDNVYENPQYVPPMDFGTLAGRTVCMSAKQHVSIHYNVHNLYGLTETLATYKALRSNRLRPFIISRSTFPGQGRFGGHWTGDVWSTWNDMKQSISAIMNFNMFGIPMVGADICGFNGDTTEQLCQRGMQLGAFYPFSRNHNSNDCVDQDPAAFGPSVAISSRNALLIRYSLLPYLHTLFFESHQFGTTVVRPLFFEFPEDRKTYNISTQFLWGKSVLIAPALEKDQVYVDTYFPDGIWYDYHLETKIISNGMHKSLHTPIDKINVFFRGGAVIPLQKAEVTTTESRKNNFDIYVIFDKQGQSQGELYMDDDDSIEPVKNRRYTFVQFKASRRMRRMYLHIVHSVYRSNLKIGSITILDLEPPTSVRLNGRPARFTFNNRTKIMKVIPSNLPIMKPFKLTWATSP